MREERVFDNAAEKTDAENEKDENRVEKKEQVKGITILLIRHGESTYEEEEWFNCNDEEWSEMKKRKEIIPFEGKLIEKGEKQMKDTAMEIAERIGGEPQKIVYLESSPKERAEKSKKILKEVLEEKGINVYSKKDLARTRDDLRDLELTGEFMERSEEQDLEWMDFWKEKHRDFEGVEQEKEFMRRLQKTISYFQQFSLKADLPSGCEPVFICLTHEEVIKNVAEHFGIPIKFVENGEILEMNIDPKKDKPDDPPELTVKIKGEKSTLSSDKLFRPSI